MLCLNEFWYGSNIICLFISVMSFPSEGVESAFKNHIDEVRNYLDYKHKNSYAVYNLSQKSYRNVKFDNRVSWYSYF